MEKATVLSPILVDTALLGRGLTSLDNSIIKYFWPSIECKLPYCHEGDIKHLSLTEMLKIRNQQELPRIDATKIKLAIPNKESGYLTASALMEIALPSNFIVTAGIGGITGERVSEDLITIAQKPIFFISSGFKDIIDAKSSLEYLKTNGVKVLGWENPIYNGFLFNNQHYELDGVINEYNIKNINFSNSKGIMIFNPLPQELKIKEAYILEKLKGKLNIYQEQGLDFHPIINQLLDEYTKGRASFIQLLALVTNLNLAREISILIGE